MKNILCASLSFWLCQELHLLIPIWGRESNGAAKILLEVSVENEAALALYQDLRFEVVGRRKAYYSDGTDAILMTKSLSPHQLVT